MSVAAALGLRLDPPMAYNFTINLVDTSSTLSTVASAALSALTDVVLGGFTECTGLETALEVEDLKVGGRNDAVLKFPTRVTWQPLVLKRGVGADTSLWDWHDGFVTGRGKRRDGVITLLNDLHLPTHIWYFKRGLPTRYTGPSMHASQNAVAIESMEITHEGIYQVPYVGFAVAAAAAGVTAAITKL